jgi:hypothetical protein
LPLLPYICYINPKSQGDLILPLLLLAVAAVVVEDKDLFPFDILVHPSFSFHDSIL